ncbi:hypothetical protein F441_04923 [Phytophthora nicotianae CJ01A1]|uniref:Uncharacterized protein n=5 Tax=Phytophthora nicotianae TaxID=4792 RepID=W2QGL1_PHYN3|nr:hypothetical protein PPTG_22476 [Phytophthora nicotianae INRA-310]ETI51813.1 hypothetical protein F443_04922 [Phytophthora nicotianae P1569]ETO80572.1 hypothetical protein F444_04965 [Phytophthora nicotianae P1976]ETP21611.1 hypothetical protein F441_04923 [Phytophthora nicotianae CJ01A1]ETP49495.1 hypothetical protein F442_04986 [Phytophthora nicotianae P10297]ETN12287.1 hypothetical protein PPTG_22476 [Phytophthora nicotianae INRA-310]
MRKHQPVSIRADRLYSTLSNSFRRWVNLAGWTLRWQRPRGLATVGEHCHCYKIGDLRRSLQSYSALNTAATVTSPVRTAGDNAQCNGECHVFAGWALSSALETATTFFLAAAAAQ